MRDKNRTLNRKYDKFSIWRIEKNNRSVEKIKQSNFDEIWKQECKNNGKKIDNAIGTRCLKFQKSKLKLIPQICIADGFEGVRFNTIDTKKYIYYFGININKIFFDTLSKVV